MIVRCTNLVLIKNEFENDHVFFNHNLKWLWFKFCPVMQRKTFNRTINCHIVHLTWPWSHTVKQKNDKQCYLLFFLFGFFVKFIAIILFLEINTVMRYLTTPVNTDTLILGKDIVCNSVLNFIYYVLKTFLFVSGLIDYFVVSGLDFFVHVWECLFI